MRINGFRCDTCCKEYLLDAREATNRMGELLPTDWYIANHGKFESGKEPLMFCSVKCLSDWAEKQNLAARELKEVEALPGRDLLPEENTRWKNW